MLPHYPPNNVIVEPARRWSWRRRMTYDPTLPAELVERLWRGDVDEMILAGTRLQTKDRCVVAQCDSPAGKLLVKRHVWGGPSRTIRMALRTPSARRCARLGRYLADRGVVTPRPRAHIEDCFGPFGFRSYLLTDFAEGTSLYRYIRSGPADPQLLDHLAAQVAQIWQRLMELGVSHNDLKPENFILDQSNNVWLIDLEKVRRHQRPAKLLRRHLHDLQRFLHVRTWRSQPEAAEPFRRALRHTVLGVWLASSADGNLLRGGYGDEELSSGVSVLIRCDRQDVGAPDTLRAIDSVSDIADEILLVAPAAARGRLEVVDRLQPGRDGDARQSPSVLPPNRSASAPLAQYPWVLVIDRHEYVTPELAREIQERVVDRADCDAFRMPLERPNAWWRLLPARSDELASVRLFRQARCSFSIGCDMLAISADPQRIGRLTQGLRVHGQAWGVAAAAAANDFEPADVVEFRAAISTPPAGDQPAKAA